MHARSAVCLPHMRLLAAAMPSAAADALLLRRQAALMERVAEDAARFALKQNAARQGSLSKEERDAASCAARVLLEAPHAQYDVTPPGAAGSAPHLRPSAQELSGEVSKAGALPWPC